MLNTKKKFPLYPFLLGLYPVISLLANNAAEIKISDGFRSIAFSLILTGLVFLILNLIIKNSDKAALLTALFIILFFSYGHLQIYLENTPLLDLDLARIRYLVPFFVIIFGIGTLTTLRSKSDLLTLTQALAVISIVALLLPLSQMGFYFIQKDRLITSASIDIDPPINLTAPESPPDVYYIILDGYSRADMLQILGYDNSQFMQDLEREGFYIAMCSQANYSWTLPSLTSTLNMKYLDRGEGLTSIKIDDEALHALLDKNTVRAVLENQGYTIAAFENGFEWLHWYDADQYYAPVGDEQGFLRLNVGMNGFELLFLETSAARLVIDTNILAPQNRGDQFISSPREIHRQRVLYTVETLPKIRDEISGPIFVYAHIVSPHNPYLFGPDGEWLPHDPEETVQAYLDQLNYLNTEILQSVKSIIQTAERPTVIILQGDHGAPIPWPAGEEENKLGILNAVYSTDPVFSQTLYPSLSPVNNFRLIFNYYFNADLNLLSDVSIIGPSSPLVELPCQP